MAPYPSPADLALRQRYLLSAIRGDPSSITASDFAGVPPREAGLYPALPPQMMGSYHNMNAMPFGAAPGAQYTEWPGYNLNVHGHSYPYPAAPGAAAPLAALMETQNPVPPVPPFMETRQPVLATAAQIMARENRLGRADPMLMAAGPPLPQPQHLMPSMETRQPVLAAAAQILARENRLSRAEAMSMAAAGPPLTRDYLDYVARPGMAHGMMPPIDAFQAHHHLSSGPYDIGLSRYAPDQMAARIPPASDSARSSYPSSRPIDARFAPIISTRSSPGMPNSANLETLGIAASNATRIGDTSQSTSVKSDSADESAQEKQGASAAAEGAAAAAAAGACAADGDDTPRRLVTPSDEKFLDPVHNFIRTHCIELFVASREDTTAPGRGARATKVGQVSHCLFRPSLMASLAALSLPLAHRVSDWDPLFLLQALAEAKLDQASHLLPFQTRNNIRERTQLPPESHRNLPRH